MRRAFHRCPKSTFSLGVTRMQGWQAGRLHKVQSLLTGQHGGGEDGVQVRRPRSLKWMLCHSLQSGLADNWHIASQQ